MKELLSGEQPLVSVGILTYNNSSGLLDTLFCIRNQTYRNLEIIISDNSDAESFSNKKIIDDIRKVDSRIVYFEQSKNIGAPNNFRFVLGKASGPFFMWASDDDLWDPLFVATGIEYLLKYDCFSSWFCGVKNIDSFDRVIRCYDSFSRFSSTSNKCIDIVKYLIEPEILGKSNLVYSLYRTEHLKEMVDCYFPSDEWGEDYCFILGFMARFDMCVIDQALFKKRIIRPTDSLNHVDPIVIDCPKIGVFPMNEGKRYKENCCRAVKGTSYMGITRGVMSYRIFEQRIRWIFQRINTFLRHITGLSLM